MPELLNCKEFVNADEIAKGLSPFQPEKVAFEAGRIMLNRIDELLSGGQTFAFETTLATKSYKSKVAEAQKEGYTVTLLFFWLNSMELAVERVKTRVSEGGHNIQHDVILRRYSNGLKNLFGIYIPIKDISVIYDNSEGTPTLIAENNKGSGLNIVDGLKFEMLKNAL